MFARPTAAAAITLPNARDTTATINLCLSIAGFVAVYLELSLWSGRELLFPNVGGFLVAVASLLANQRAIRPTHILWVAAVVGAAAIWTFGAASFGGSASPTRIRAILQFTIAIITSYGLFLAMIGSHRGSLATAMLALFGIVVVGSLLETIGLIQGISDAVRWKLYPANLVYDADFRDLVSYGGVRPRFFSREPSIVGISAGFLLVMGMLLARGGVLRRALAMIVAGIVATTVIRSPTIMMFVLIGLAGLVMADVRQPLYRPLARLVFMVLLFAFLLFVPVTDLLGRVFGGILLDITTGGSFQIRIVGPPSVAMEVWRQAPVFGFGLGGFDTLFSTVRRVYAGLGVFGSNSWLLEETDARYLLSNALWEFAIFFGFAGSILMTLVLRRMLIALGVVTTLFPFLGAVIAWQTFGGLATLRTWYVVFGFAAVVVILARQPAPSHRAR